MSDHIVAQVETDADFDAVVAVHNAVDLRNPVLRDELRAWTADLPHAFFVVRDGEEPVGAARIVAEPGRLQPVARLEVLAGRRRQGIGSALFAAVSSWARSRDATSLEGWIHADDEDGLAFVRNRGFEQIGKEITVELDLRGLDAPAVDPPAGIAVVTWAERPESARGLYEVYCEASPDIPGEEDDELEPYEDWLRHHMSGPGDLPEATFVALAGDEVVGYSKFSLTRAQPEVAHHDLTGVKRAWRGRGIAGALKRKQIAWAKEQGYERLSTRNEERNAPIRKLNERYGYRPTVPRLTFRGPIGAP